MPDSRTSVEWRWFANWPSNGRSTAEVGKRFAVTPATVRKWLGRYLAGGEAALADASSGQPDRRRPSRVLARAGLSKLSDLAPREPVQRYEHPAPGDLLHIVIPRSLDGSSGPATA